MWKNECKWTEEQDKRLIELWKKEKSGSQIAFILVKEFTEKITKNSVIGRAHRINKTAKALGLPEPCVPRRSPIKISSEEIRAKNAEYMRQYRAKEQPMLPILETLDLDLNKRTDAYTPSGVLRADRVRLGARSSNAIPVQLKIMPINLGVVCDCCWPMWGKEKPTHIYCNQKSMPNKSYCEKHFKKSTVQSSQSSLTKLTNKIIKMEMR